MATATPNTPTQNGTSGQQQQSNSSAPNETDSLWPKSQKLQFILVTGEYESGKTLFGLLIDPKGRTCHFDTEDSAEPYEGQIPFTRIDVPELLAKKFPNGDYRPKDVHDLINEQTKSIPEGKYKVGILDCGTEYEDGAVAYVQSNPVLFGYTANQFQKSQALMWGAVKSYLKKQLSYWNTKFETFVVCVHMRDEWKGGAPTGKREAKGKETLSELASLALLLERPVDPKTGKKQEKPSAIVLKSRLSHFERDKKTGDLIPHPMLPPRLPVATPAAIRDYINSPPDYAKLKKGEKIQSHEFTDEERMRMQARITEDQRAIAEAEAQKAQAEAARARYSVGGGGVPQQTAGAAGESQKSDSASGPQQERSHESEPTTAPPVITGEQSDTHRSESDGRSPDVQGDQPAPVYSDQSDQPQQQTTADQQSPTPADVQAAADHRKTVMVEIAQMKSELEITSEQWAGAMQKNFQVQSAKELSTEQLEKLAEALAKKLVAKRAEETKGSLDKWAEGATEK